MKRAHVIVTDADYVFVHEAWAGRTTQEVRVEPTEQLLADLRYVLDYALRHNITMADEGFEVYKRVRALLPEDGGE